VSPIDKIAPDQYNYTHCKLFLKPTFNHPNEQYATN